MPPVPCPWQFHTQNKIEWLLSQTSMQMPHQTHVLGQQSLSYQSGASCPQSHVLGNPRPKPEWLLANKKRQPNQESFATSDHHTTSLELDALDTLDSQGMSPHSTPKPAHKHNKIAKQVALGLCEPVDTLVAATIQAVLSHSMHVQPFLPVMWIHTTRTLVCTGGLTGAIHSWRLSLWLAWPDHRLQHGSGATARSSGKESHPQTPSSLDLPLKRMMCSGWASLTTTYSSSCFKLLSLVDSLVFQCACFLFVPKPSCFQLYILLVVTCISCLIAQ